LLKHSSSNRSFGMTSARQEASLAELNPDPQDAKLSLAGAVYDSATGDLELDTYKSLKELFQRDGLVRLPVAALPGTFLGEAPPAGVRHWEDARGKGWVATHPSQKVVKVLRAKWFGVGTWKSWRLAFLLARLQRQAWEAQDADSARSTGKRQAQDADAPRSAVKRQVQDAAESLRSTVKQPKIDAETVARAKKKVAASRVSGAFSESESESESYYPVRGQEVMDISGKRKTSCELPFRVSICPMQFSLPDLAARLFGFLEITTLFRVSGTSYTASTSAWDMIEKRFHSFEYQHSLFTHKQTPSGRRRVAMRQDEQALRVIAFLGEERINRCFVHLDLRHTPAFLLEDLRILDEVRRMPRLQSITYPAHGWSTTKALRKFEASNSGLQLCKIRQANSFATYRRRFR